MGCKGSKLEDQEAVALCRGRANLLAAAVRHRYALADAHGDLADSLASGGDAAPPPPQQQEPGASSHIDFATSSSDSDSGSSASSSPRRRVDHHLPHPHHHHLPHPTAALPHPHYGYGYAAPEPPFGVYAPGSLRVYYARSRPPPPSVAVEQRAPAPERVYFGYSADRGYPQHLSYGEPARAGRMVTPPPPSPPRESSWDFFNVFGEYDVYDNYYYDAAAAAGGAAVYTPGRTSWEVRREEGIPDLEEEDVVVKQVDSEYSAPGSGARSRRSSLGGASSGGATEADQVENSVAEKEVMGNVARQHATAQRNVAASVPAPRGAAEGPDVAGQIKQHFVRASDAARALAPILEVGRRKHHSRSSVYHVVSSRMVSAIAVSHPDNGPVELLDVGEEKVIGGRSLSLTLQKLYIWEKKLYHEVKAEEKMRLLLAKNSKRLKFLDLKGAETDKIDKTRNLVKKLSTKIRISMRVISKVSRKINRIRDDELWPQINALVQGYALLFCPASLYAFIMNRASGDSNCVHSITLDIFAKAYAHPETDHPLCRFVRMWQDKLECYQIQCQVMSGAKDLDLVSGRSNRESAMELELELIKWIVNFSCWVNLQRSFVKALNGWLALCLNYKAEETADGVPPSPGRVGAPRVFVVCNRWSQAMDRISEKEVVTSLQALVSTVRKLSEQHTVEQTEQLIAIREREKWNRILERKTLEINKEADTLNKKLALVPGRQNLLPSAHTYKEHHLEASSLQASLGRVVQALESFASNSMKAFEEILRHAEGERAQRENAKAS
ncbi:hypothetical protein PR202_gb09318 [Eleusine coracana subsp. coracana]|uniref:Uncharacterized protein n=1 Tax=Eleusine coracana subsp. coracana TaxID=191504 RepID=A0AAV5EGW5_ELECO|nr:hypothetical protein PR202_gb09318 [Eleusine coracana subsp. coracana]